MTEYLREGGHSGKLPLDFLKITEKGGDIM
jgi:hypothetical protein